MAIINKVSNVTKNVVIFVIPFSSCSVLLCKRFSLKIINDSCNKGPRYYKFMRKRNKAKHIVEKDNSQIYSI